MAQRKYPAQKLLGLPTNGVRVARPIISDRRESRDEFGHAICEHRSKCYPYNLLEGRFCKNCSAEIVRDDPDGRERYHEALRDSLSPRRGEEPSDEGR